MPSPYQTPQLPSARRRLCGCRRSGPARRSPQQRGRAELHGGHGALSPPGNTPRPGRAAGRQRSRCGAAGGVSPQCSTGMLRGALSAAQPAGTRTPRGHRVLPRPLRDCATARTSSGAAGTLSPTAPLKCWDTGGRRGSGDGAARTGSAAMGGPRRIDRRLPTSCCGAPDPLIGGDGPGGARRRDGAKGCPKSHSYLPPPAADAPAAISYLPLRMPIGPPRHPLGPAPPALHDAIGCGRHRPAAIGRFERATADPRARGGECGGTAARAARGTLGVVGRRRRPAVAACRVLGTPTPRASGLGPRRRSGCHNRFTARNSPCARCTRACRAKCSRSTSYTMNCSSHLGLSVLLSLLSIKVK